MADKKKYIIDEKIVAILLYEYKQNYSEVARLFNCHATTVKYWVTHKENLYALYKTNRKSLYNYNGYKIKQEHTDFIVELYLSNPEISLSQLAIALKNEFNLDVSPKYLGKVIKPFREQLDFLKECLLKQSDITIKALDEALQKKFNVIMSLPHLRYVVKNLR